MSSETTTSVLAERIGDITFKRDNNTNFLGYGKTGVMVIKVGTVEKEITFSVAEFDNNSLDEKKGDIKNNINKVFSNVYELGLNIDYSKIEEDYKSELEKELSIDKGLKTIYYTEKYNESWLNEIKDINIDGLELTCDTVDEFVNNCIVDSRKGIYARLTYKDYTTKVQRADISRSHKTTLRFVLGGEITGYKDRNYTKLQSLCEKFVILVDFMYDSAKAEKVAIINRAIMVEKTLKFLTDKFATDGVNVVNGTRWERQSATDDKDEKLKISNKYFIIVGGKELSISYNESRGYAFLGLYDLEEQQVKDIIKILNV